MEKEDSLETARLALRKHILTNKDQIRYDFWLENMKYVLNRIEEDLNNMKSMGDDMVSRSWGYEEGILITGKEAEEIIKFIKSKL